MTTSNTLTQTERHQTGHIHCPHDQVEKTIRSHDDVSVMALHSKCITRSLALKHCHTKLIRC